MPHDASGFERDTGYRLLRARAVCSQKVLPRTGASEFAFDLGLLLAEGEDDLLVDGAGAGESSTAGGREAEGAEF